MFTEALLGQQQQQPKASASVPGGEPPEQSPLAPAPPPDAAQPHLQAPPQIPAGTQKPGLPGPPTFAIDQVGGASGGGSGLAGPFWYPAGLPADGPPLGRAEADWTEEAAGAVVRLTTPTVSNSRDHSHPPTPL